MTTQTYHRARHSVSLLHAHLVFVTNYRQLVQRLKGRIAYPVRREYTGACVRARMRGHL